MIDFNRFSNQSWVSIFGRDEKCSNFGCWQHRLLTIWKSAVCQCRPSMSTSTKYTKYKYYISRSFAVQLKSVGQFPFLSTTSTTGWRQPVKNAVVDVKQFTTFISSVNVDNCIFLRQLQGAIFIRPVFFFVCYKISFCMSALKNSCKKNYMPHNLFRKDKRKKNKERKKERKKKERKKKGLI